MTIILMIRHGENDFLGKRLAGRLPGVHLNEAGKQQAQNLAQFLSQMPLQAIFSSPMERARETAQPLATARGLEIQIETGLNEINYGEWQGKTFEELRKLELWTELRESPGKIRFPGGESFQEAQQRVAATLEKIAGLAENMECVACFTHADVVRLAAANLLKLSLEGFQRLAADTASVTVIEKTADRERLIRANQTIANPMPFPMALRGKNQNNLNGGK